MELMSHYSLYIPVPYCNISCFLVHFPFFVCNLCSGRGHGLIRNIPFIILPLVIPTSHFDTVCTRTTALSRSSSLIDPLAPSLLPHSLNFTHPGPITESDKARVPILARQFNSSDALSPPLSS